MQEDVIINVGITVDSGSMWTKQWGSSYSDAGYSIVVDSSGDIYVTGYTEGRINGNQYLGSRDIFLTKYTSDGTKLWTKQFGSIYDDYGCDLTIDDLGNVYVVGNTCGSFDGNQNVGSYDIFLTKYDSSGVKLWTCQFGSVSGDYATSIAVNSSGEVFIAGYTSGGIDEKTNAGGSDAFLAKYSSSGEYFFTKQFGSSSDDYAYGVAVDTSGNIYVTGYTRGGLDGNINIGAYDVFLTKYDSLRNKLWTRQWGSSSNDYGYSVTVDTSGNVFVTGDISGDVFLAKFSPDGEILWERQLGDVSSGECGNDIAIDNSGNIYITGRTNGRIDENLNAGFDDIFLIKYTSDGTKLWTKQWGTPSSDRGFSIAIDMLGNIYVSGYTSGKLDWNEHYGGLDVFLTKFEY